MSTTPEERSTDESTTADEDIGTDEIPPKANVVIEYLKARVEKEGVCYLKSRDIASDIELSPKEIGAYMERIGEQTTLSVEPWAYTKGTTWRISE
ncbi:DUF7123 family protein [Halovenus marina]|uniref:DUF7123 family protein n=1 Tax=Halovenus marina TaxID=3396621 RepID=UPI003F54E83B